MYTISIAETPITLLLLLANVLVSGYALYSDPSLISRLAFRPYQILRGKQYYRLITAGFVHVGLWHLAFNMISLYFFGPYLELVLGSLEFFILYFGAELAAHGLSLWLKRNDMNYSAVGASGAVSGVVLGFCMFEPFRQLLVFFVPMPAILFAVVYIGGSIYAMRQADRRGQVGGIAHEAHLGGALGGILLTILLEPRSLTIFVSKVAGLIG